MGSAAQSGDTALTDFASRRRKLSPAAAVERQRHRDALAVVEAEFRARRNAVMVLVAEGQVKVGEAARIVGVSPATIRRQARKLGIDPRAARANYLNYVAANAANFAFMLDQMIARPPTVGKLNHDQFSCLGAFSFIADLASPSEIRSAIRRSIANSASPSMVRSVRTK
jgi:hypothetical protein